MGNEKMSNLPGTPGWIARNNGKKYAETQTETENIEKEAGAKDVVGKLSFGRKGYRDLMAANERFQEVGDRYRKGEASEDELSKAREEYEPTRKKSVKSFATRYGIAAATPLAIALGLKMKDKFQNKK